MENNQNNTNENKIITVIIVAVIVSILMLLCGVFSCTKCTGTFFYGCASCATLRDDGNGIDTYVTTTDSVEDETEDSTTETKVPEESETTTKKDVIQTTDAKESEETETTTKKDIIQTADTKESEESETTTKKDVIQTTDTIKKLKVTGANLTDEDGNIIQLKGISTHGLAWFPQYVNDKCFKQLHNEMGVQLIRLVMYSAENNGYCTGGNKEELKALVKKGVKYATDNGMYVIIDWHVHGERNPNVHKEEAKKFFKEMAQLYADYDNVFYEICNEPSGGTTWSEIKSYALEIIPIIRQYDEDGIIIVGTPNWSQYVTHAAKDPITEYDNIMYTLHFYAATHTDSLRSEMVNAINMGLPIFVTEYGICDASGNGGIDEYQANKWMQLLDKYGISSAMWNLSNKNETSAILKSSCSKKSGFTESDLSAAGKWFVNMLKGSTDIGNGELSDGENDNFTENEQATTTKQETTTSIEEYKITAEATATLANSWSTGTEYYYQYIITVKNTADKTCTSWEADIEFDGNITISQGWNGEYSADGNVLHITPVSHNGTIEPGQSVTDIGIIIYSTEPVTLK
ncbi:MAG: hypothetical protein E7266_07785 [Lachnospiraceae bacterium]|nr:hypothetical protein [Lachnospiraceae bacterium]